MGGARDLSYRACLDSSQRRGERALPLRGGRGIAQAHGVRRDGVDMACSSPVRWWCGRRSVRDAASRTPTTTRCTSATTSAAGELPAAARSSARLLKLASRRPDGAWLLFGAPLRPLARRAECTDALHATLLPRRRRGAHHVCIRLPGKPALEAMGLWFCCQGCKQEHEQRTAGAGAASPHHHARQQPTTKAASPPQPAKASKAAAPPAAPPPAAAPRSKSTASAGAGAAQAAAAPAAGRATKVQASTGATAPASAGAAAATPAAAAPAAVAPAPALPVSPSLSAPALECARHAPRGSSSTS